MLEKGRAKKRKYDDAAFYLYDNNNLQGILCSHVEDDYCWCGTEQFEVKIIKLINKYFWISLEELETFRYLGLNVQQTYGYIKIDQISYINELKVKISQEKGKNKFA